MEIILIQRQGKGLSKEDNPLSWQKPQPKEKLTPVRVAQSLPGVLVAITQCQATPDRHSSPYAQTLGKSPGYQKGTIRTKKNRFPIVKKGKGRFESQKQATETAKSA